MAKKKEEMNEAILWQKERNGIRCLICARNCFISKDKKGYCQLKENRNNKLYTLNFGKVISLEVRPMEKNPLYHFYPNTDSLAFGIPGCNFFSQFCPSFEISQGLHEKPIEELKYDQYSPEDIAEMAEKKNCKVITFDYTEPTISIEFAFRAAKMAARSNIKNAFVTNGFMSEEAVKKIGKFLDAITVNFHASLDKQFYEKYMSISDIQLFFDALRQMKKQRVFIEITDTIVPQIGDNLDQFRKLAEWVSNELGSEVPFHVLQFHPQHSIELPLTPVSTLERFADEAKKVGLRYIYIGNVGLDENTYCHNCRELLISRKNSVVKKINLVQDRCPNCGFGTHIITE